MAKAKKSHIHRVRILGVIFVALGISIFSWYLINRADIGKSNVVVVIAFALIFVGFISQDFVELKIQG